MDTVADYRHEAPYLRALRSVRLDHPHVSESMLRGDPALELLTIFLWPVMLLAFLRARFLKKKPD
jgi:hypothetical protein